METVGNALSMIAVGIFFGVILFLIFLINHQRENKGKNNE